MLSAAAAPSASAHAAFVGAQPAPGVRVEASPQRVVLTFTEPLNARLSRGTLTRSDGEPAPLAAHAASRERLVLRPRELDTGAYRVTWHTVSTEDGHALEGTFSFGVRAEAAGPGHTLEQSPLARSGWLRVSMRFLLYAAVLLLAAGLLVPLLLRDRARLWPVPPGVSEEHDVEPAVVTARERRLVEDLAWVSVGAAVAVAVTESADAAGAVSIGALRDFLLTGTAGFARIAVVGALLLAALAAGRRPRLAALSVVVALGGVAASGHASSATPRIPSVVNDWLHLIAGAVWLGGIGFVLLLWAPTLRRGGRPARRAVARHVLPLFGHVALPAFLLVSATGIVSLLTQLGRLDALWTTAYGNVLLAKIALVALIATASGVHVGVLRRRLLSASVMPEGAERAHWRLLQAERLGALGVVAAAALLVVFPLPPRQVGDANDAQAATPACDPCPLPRPTAAELAVAEQAGDQIVAGWLRREGSAVRGTIRLLDRRGQPSTSPFDVVGATKAGCGRGCLRFSLAATRELRVSVATPGRSFVATLPTVWKPGADREADRLLRRAERTMRALRTARQVEQVTSGPGSYARIVYTVQAPDRMKLVTGLGLRTISIGSRTWSRTKTTPWASRPDDSPLGFSVRRFFRWTPYATSARLLTRRHRGGRPVAELALMDQATPVWQRLTIDERSGRVLRERTITRAHFIRSRFEAFNDRLTVTAPDGH